MKKIIILIAIFACACGSKSLMTAFTFQDEVEPCLKVTFTDPVSLDEVDDEGEDGADISTYTFSMVSHPELAFTLEKLFDDDNELASTPVNQGLSPMETIYEILPSDNFPTRTAALVFERGKEGMYLVSKIGEGNKREAFIFSIKTLIRRSEYMASFSGTQWVATTAGKRFIENMIDQTHWYYSNINSCTSAETMMEELDASVSEPAE